LQQYFIVMALPIQSGDIGPAINRCRYWANHNRGSLNSCHLNSITNSSKWLQTLQLVL